jgi:hypothetical protein
MALTVYRAVWIHFKGLCGVPLISLALDYRLALAAVVHHPTQLGHHHASPYMGIMHRLDNQLWQLESAGC